MCPRPCLDLPILSLRAAGKHPSRLEKLTAIGWDRNNPDCIPRTMEAIHAIHPHAVPVVAGWEPGLDTRIKEEHNMTEIDRTC